MSAEPVELSPVQRGGALAGIGFVVLSIASLITSPHGRPVSGKPDSLFAPGDEWADYILSHHGAGESYVWVGLALGSVLGLWWLGTVRSVLDASNTDRDGLGTVAFSGGLFMFVMFWVGAAIQFSVTYRPDEALTGAVVRPFLIALATASTFGMIGLVAFASATTAMLQRSQSLPRWLTWLGAITATTGSLVLLAPLLTSGPFAIGGAANIALTQGLASGWIVAVSTAMLRSHAGGTASY